MVTYPHGMTRAALVLAGLALATPAPAQAPAMRGVVFELRFAGEDPLPFEAIRASTRAIRACARHAPEGDVSVEAFTARVGADGHLSRLRPERPAASPQDRRRHACLARVLSRVTLPRRRPPAELRVVLQWEPDTELDPGPLSPE
jgi:hypothetical protein